MVHRRELLPHQKSLIIGLSGEIRTCIVRYRSKMETPDDCFPRLECIRDSVGTSWNVGTGSRTGMVTTKLCLRPGDKIDYVVTASDPQGGPLKYSIRVFHSGDDTTWTDSNELSLTVEERHISRDFTVILAVKSERDYHASADSDDSLMFIYTVLPNKAQPVARPSQPGFLLRLAWPVPACP